jgi:hypothetical protein
MLRPFPESEQRAFHVRVVGGVDDGEELVTPEQSITIGRSPECRLVLNDRKASRIHGELAFARQRAIYRDLLSHNGSWIETPDQQQVRLGPLLSEWQVGAGDKIHIGDSTVQIVAAELPASDASQAFDFLGTLPLDSEVVHPAEQGAFDPDTMTRLSRFVALPSYDPTDVQQAKYSLAQAILDVYPHADCVAIVNISPPDTGQSSRWVTAFLATALIRWRKHSLAARSYVIARGTPCPPAIVCGTSECGLAFARRSFAATTSRDSFTVIPSATIRVLLALATCNCLPCCPASPRC